MAHIVTCIYCKKKFDRDKYPFVQVANRRYAHVDCSMTEDQKRSKEEVDKEELDAYIMKLFNITFIDPRIRKQIKQYVEEYHYTYSGIRKTLIYFYEIKGNSLEKSNGGIGIVPHVYQKAHNYYLALWQAQQKNENKVVKEFVPTVKEIVIPRPQRNVKQRNLFSFLDEEEGMNGK
jgi:hypothetical protein